MAQRIVSVWFQHLATDCKIRRQPSLKEIPFVLALQEHNRSVVKAVNKIAQARGIYTNMVVADGKAIVPDLLVLNYDEGKTQKLLTALAEWCICYTPLVTLDAPDGLFFDASGCSHLWGGEENYLNNIVTRFKKYGYTVHVAIADTAGTAWAACRFRKKNSALVLSGAEADALSALPPAALRIENEVIERLQKLGLTTIGSFMKMPRTALRRRFGQNILTRLDQALGTEMELMEPVRPVLPYHERLPVFEPIRTATGIEFALNTLLDQLCLRMTHESKGLRICELRCYRLDGNIQTIEIGTHLPSRNVAHLFKLFELKIPQIEPDLGIELFVLEARVVENLSATQDVLWAIGSSSEKAIAELQDRLAGKIGEQDIQCYIPEEHHWPEHSIKQIPSLIKNPPLAWPTNLPRPSHLLLSPEPIEVSVPLPDYPPLLFIHKGIQHPVKKADGPERIEQEWWKQEGLFRDYYYVEDERGERYWLFRSGDYNKNTPKWFIHGFFS